MVQVNPLWVAYEQSQTSPSGPAFISQLTGTGFAGYFTDQNSNPRLMLNDEPWGLPANAGRWNSGNWQADYDGYFNARGTQKFTAAVVNAVGHTHTGGSFDDGRTWDGIYPFTQNGTPGNLTGSGTVALNNAYWTRIDYMFAAAKRNGISACLNFSMTCDLGLSAHGFTGGVWLNASATQMQAGAAAIAARYSTTQNLFWVFGDDYYNDDDTAMNAFRAGVASQDTRINSTLSIEYYPTGTTSHIDLSAPGGTTFPFGTSYATFNWCYYYWTTYFAIETAYADADPITVVWGDGFYYGDAGGEPYDSHIVRNMAWWALASGARGITTGSDAVFVWSSSSLAAVTSETWFASQAANVYTAFTSRPGWWKLIPDTSNLLVTAGRGTRGAYSNQEFLGGNIGSVNYVAASRAPDGSLAVIYCAVAMSITIDQTKMQAGYTAHWVDPASGAATLTTSGSTYSSSGLGNNSAGAPDWVLILQGP